MPQNEFKPFAVASNAAVLGQKEYETSQALREGFKKGLARSVEVNKAIRQASSIAAAVAEFAAEKSGKDMLDNGEVGILKENFEMALSAVSSLLIAEAQGTGDMLTASFSPELLELKNGTLVHVRAKERNRTKTPVFKADETGQKVIVKGNNLNLEEGDIAGAGHWLELQYDGALDKWVLENPAKGITPSSGVPLGTIEYFATATPPPGYLKADGAAVGREAYPELFAAIGNTFGEGDGETTFNLPDLIDRFAQGGHTPGQKIEAGLPNITSSLETVENRFGASDGALYTSGYSGNSTYHSGGGGTVSQLNFDASRSNPKYGASDTVQPPALTLLPCIKAFDATSNPGLIDITALAQEMANKTDKSVAAHAAMPSERRIEFTLPANEGTLTFPDDGYVVSKILATSGDFSFDAYINGVYVASHIGISAFGAKFIFAPVAAGTKAIFYNTTGKTPEYANFVYAQGVNL